MIVARVILSWVAPRGGGVVGRYLYDMTEPVLGFCRRIFPFGRRIGLDFSPIIAIILLELLEMLIRFLFFGF